METRNEIWKDIEGYEGYYQVSNFGRVRSVDRVVEWASPKGTVYSCFKKGRIIKAFLRGKGYNSVNFSKNGINHPIYIHFLVAKAFVNGYKSGFQVNHIDENKNNNKADNLEWISGKENTNKSTLLKCYIAKTKKPVLQLSKDGKLLCRFDSIRQAALFTGVHKSHIKDVCRNRGGRKFAGGYRWRFADD